MQAIRTKFLPATNTRCSRIKAVHEKRKLTIPFRHDKILRDNHISAARMLARQLAREQDATCCGFDENNLWRQALVSGRLPDGTMVHVFLCIDQ